jgi:hypothetical protein
MVTTINAKYEDTKRELEAVKLARQIKGRV